MSLRCVLCGEFASEERGINIKAGEVCYECLDGLVEDEIERRAERVSETKSNYRIEDSPSYRSSMIDAGRGHLLR